MSAVTPLTSDQLREYLQFAEDLMHRAGEIARRHFSHDIAVEVKTEDNTPLTIADTAINQLVIDEVSARYPQIGVLGEEASKEVDSPDKLLWVCDPIDGTIPYSLHLPMSTGCLALVHDGVPVVGVVYDYMADRMFSAYKGSGARLNGQPFTPDAGTTMKMIDMESWPASVVDVKNLRATLLAAAYQLPNFCSYAYTCMLVAQGRIEGAVYAGAKPWDGAASKVILGELGILMTDARGQEPRFDGSLYGLLTARPETHELLVSALAE
ncbi:MAG TPA: inositol monophosphatase [Candidatus Saccharimonadales bacterium]|nr:inositol monophosphatase [Candidatus Saccharimonadales bacterium]